MTQGPSLSSHGVMAQALPGRSIFICVPTVMKSSMAAMHAGLALAAAKPEGRARPYLKRKPPASRGAPKTGLPAMMSFMNLEMGATCRDVNPFVPPSSFSLPLAANLETKSQPGTFNRSVCF